MTIFARQRRTRVALAILALVATGFITSPLTVSASAPSNMTTAGYNNLRDNWDPNEPMLSPADVASSAFGQRFATQLDGSIYAQPLIYNGIVIVTTEKAITYGINASSGAIVWQHAWGTDFTTGAQWGSPFEADTIGCGDLVPDLGSTSTPVIDPATGILYLTTRLEVPALSTDINHAHWFVQAIHAVNGAPVAQWPADGVEVRGTPYNTPGLAFNDNFQMQRPGLLLLHHVVYLGFASNCDINPYRGILAGISTTTASLTSMWSTESGAGTDANSRAGIWQGGGGLVSDQSGRIVVATGNGVSPTPAPSNAPPATLSESVVALSIATNGQITPQQFFAPSNATSLDAWDADLASGGPIALPPHYFGTSRHPDLLVEVGKDGRVFLLDANNLGGYQQGTGGGDAVLGVTNGAGGVWGHPAAYGGQGGYVYVVDSGGGPLQAFQYVAGAGTTTPQLAAAATSTNSFGYASGSAYVTSNGTNTNSAVVWALDGDGSDGGNGTLIAYNAVPSNGVLTPMWSGAVGTISKFSTPSSWGGRIFVGTRDGMLLSYGLAASRPLEVSPFAFGDVPVGSTQSTTVHIAVNHTLTITGTVGLQGQQSLAGSATGGVVTTTTTTLPVTTTTLKTAGARTPPALQVVALPRSAFVVHQPAVGTTFVAGSTMTLTVGFHPTVPGQTVGSLIIPTSIGDQSVSISGYGTANGLVTTATKILFGTIPTGAGRKSLSLAITNSSAKPERITGIDTAAGPYRITAGPKVGTVLAPQASASVTVSFAPLVAGHYPSSLTLRSSGGDITVPIVGAATSGQGQLDLSTTSIDLGAVTVGGQARATITLSNSGTVALLLTQVAAPAGPFAVLNPVSPDQSIEPDTTISQTIVFTPTTTGAFTGLYRFNTDTGQPMLEVTLHGTGVAP